MRLLPICMTVNEERFIRQCLTPLANIFPVVIVADTGSEDNALVEIAKVPHLHLMHYDHPDMAELGKIRGYMSEVAGRMGATHVLQVDGDEIYPSSYLRYIHASPMPEGVIAGYTYGIDIEEMPNGEIWKYEGNYQRLAIFSVDTEWQGEYPFERPAFLPLQDPGKEFRWYPGTSKGFWHMHHLKRSTKDSETKLRVEKQHQFCMVDMPERKPVEFLLPSWDDYKDE